MPPLPSPGTRLRAVSAVCLLALVTAAVFLPALSGEFLSWDDDVYVTRNPMVAGFSWRSIPEAFTSFRLGIYHPLTVISYGVERRLFGLDPFPYHLVNLLLHLANVLLVRAALLRLSVGGIGAAAGALLFGLHAFRVESVAWVADRKDLLAAFFLLVSLLLHLGRRGDRPRARIGLALAAFLAALLAKGTVAAFPLALLAVDWLRDGRISGRALAEKIPFALLALPAGLLAFAARGSDESVLLGEISAEAGFGPGTRLAVAVYRLGVVHTARILVPGLWRDIYPLTPSLEIRTVPVIASLALVAALAVAVVLSLRRTRALAFGAVFYVVMLAPSLAAMNIGHTADRFTYAPFLGIAYLGGVAADAAWLRASRRGIAGRWAVAVGLVVVLALAAAGARARIPVWRDSLSLWNDAVSANPGDPAPLVNRGQALVARGEIGAAVADFSAAIRLAPAYPKAYGKRGFAHARQGNYEAAFADFSRAVALQPRMASAWSGLGIARSGLGDRAGAIRDLTRAVELDPGSADYRYNRGVTEAMAGDDRAAVEDFGAAIALDPTHAAAYEMRARARLRSGDTRLAAEDAAAAARLGRAVGPDLLALPGVAASPVGGRPTASSP